MLRLPSRQPGWRGWCRSRTVAASEQTA